MKTNSNAYLQKKIHLDRLVFYHLKWSFQIYIISCLLITQFAMPSFPWQANGRKVPTKPAKKQRVAWPRMESSRMIIRFGVPTF